MIYVVLEDGTRRALDQAKVKLTWTEPSIIEGEEDIEREFDLSQVAKFVFVEPTMMVKPGLMGGAAAGMPVVGVAFTDPSDFAVEIVFPADYLDQVADGLKDEAAAARSLSSKAREIQARLDAPIEISTSMADVKERFGGTVLDPTTPMPGAKE